MKFSIENNTMSGSLLDQIETINSLLLCHIMANDKNKLINKYITLCVTFAFEILSTSLISLINLPIDINNTPQNVSSILNGKKEILLNDKQSVIIISIISRIKFQIRPAIKFVFIKLMILVKI